MSQHRFIWVGGALILVGVVLLLHRIGLLFLEGRDILWGLLALFGAVKLFYGFTMHASGRAFWGAGFLLSGIAGLLHPIHMSALQALSPVSIFFLIFGVSLVAAFLSNPREWHLIVPALFITGLGVMFAASDYEYFYWLDFADSIQKYWPVVLVLFGVSLLVNRRSA